MKLQNYLTDTETPSKDMDIQQSLNILKKYPFFDVEKDGVVVRKQVATGLINAELIAEVIRQYGEVYFIPKRMRGNCPYQIAQRIKTDFSVFTAPITLSFSLAK